MKTFIVLLASAVMALTTMTPLVASADTLMTPPDKPRYELKGPLNDYYIGIHRPDGSCQTVEVYAPSYDEAVKAVKKNRCDFCVLDDKTPYFTSGSPDVIKQANRTCPR